MERVELIIEDDDSRTGGGFARLLFAVERSPPPAGLQVALRRGGEADPWLGPSGWQASEHLFRSHAVAAEAQGLCVIVGPEVVNLVEAFTSIMVSLPEFGVYGVATWETTPGFAIAPPPARVRAPLEVPFQLQPGGSIAFLASPEDLGDFAPPDRLEPGQGHLGIAYDALHRTFQGRLEIHPETGEARVLVGPGKPPRRIAFSAIGDGGLLLKGGDLHPYEAHLAAGERLFGLESAPLAAMGQGLVELDPETLTAQLIAAPGMPPPPPIETAPKRHRWLAPLIVFLLVAGGTAAGLYLNKTTPKPSPKELYGKGLAAFQAGRFDEARPLLRQAAEVGGNREAALLLAQAIDSLNFEAGLFTAADDTEALRLYSMACAPGDEAARTQVLPAAKEGLTALDQVLKAKADKGDAVAGDVLRGFFKEAEELCQ